MAFPKGRRKTHCKNGHAFTEDNIYWYYIASKGYWAMLCRECRKAVSKERAEEKKRHNNYVRTQVVDSRKLSERIPDKWHQLVYTEPNTGCWIWAYALTEAGYGKLEGRGAHIFFYETFKGSIPEGRQIHHKCNNRPCVNPDHLEAVSPQLNIDFRDLGKELPKYCRRGHEYTPENTYIKPSNGKRKCKECRRIEERELYYQGKRANSPEWRKGNQ